MRININGHHWAFMVPGWNIDCGSQIVGWIDEYYVLTHPCQVLNASVMMSLISSQAHDHALTRSTENEPSYYYVLSDRTVLLPDEYHTLTTLSLLQEGWIKYCDIRCAFQNKVMV